MLQGIPGVGPSLAAEILKKFGSIAALCHASKEELLKIKGIGKINAGQIHNTIHDVVVRLH